jgi:hypothetical protein
MPGITPGWKWVEAWMNGNATPLSTPPHPYNSRRNSMVLHESFYLRRSFWPVKIIHDVADYKIGYMISLPFLKIMKIKVSKIMDTPRYATFITIFGKEYVKT